MYRSKVGSQKTWIPDFLVGAVVGIAVSVFLIYLGGQTLYKYCAVQVKKECPIPSSSPLFDLSKELIENRPLPDANSLLSKAPDGLSSICVDKVANGWLVWVEENGQDHRYVADTPEEVIKAVKWLLLEEQDKKGKEKRDES